MKDSSPGHDSAGPYPKNEVTRRERFCEDHGAGLMWANCGNCSEGYTHHDCGEDCCCCRYPEDNVKCDICEGEGGFWLCPVCAPNADY